MSRRHPLDHKFLELIKRMRARGPPKGPQRTWLAFQAASKLGPEPYFYNFKDGKKSFIPPPPELMIQPVPRGMLPVYTRQLVNERIGSDQQVCTALRHLLSICFFSVFFSNDLWKLTKVLTVSIGCAVHV